MSQKLRNFVTGNKDTVKIQKQYNYVQSHHKILFVNEESGPRPTVQVVITVKVT